MEKKGEEITLLSIGNTVVQAVRLLKADKKGRVSGTGYTIFFHITDIYYPIS